MPGKIFISYRRDDARGDARSIYQRLERTFGSRNLFIDVDTIEKGKDFREVLERHLERCQTMLVIMGNHWRDVGEQRFADPSDFVRLEIETALKRNITVIPVLVDGARMPSESQLPDALKPLLYRQAATVSHDGFARDMAALEHDIRRSLRRDKRPMLWVGATVAATLIASGIGAYYLNLPSWIFARSTNPTPTNTGTGTGRTLEPPVMRDRPGPQPTKPVEPAVKLPSAPRTSAATYDVEAATGLAGTMIGASNIRLDASNTKPGIDECARICTNTLGCVAFEISVVYGKCSTYLAVEKRYSLGGHIAGIRK